MTTEDKNWLYIGVGLLATGGAIYWYKNKDNLKEVQGFEKPLNLGDIEATIVPTKATPKYVANGPGTTNPKATSKITAKDNVPPKPIVIPEATFMYAKGQKIMCNVRGGLQALDVQKKADGEFWTKTVKVKKFGFGDEIGTIVGIKKKDGFIFYIVTGTYHFGSESFDSRYFWINHFQIKGIAPLMKTTGLSNVPTLDVTKVLQKGSKGFEVNELQRRLRIDIDGDFGNKTETALLQQKNTKAISLQNF